MIILQIVFDLRSQDRERKKVAEAMGRTEREGEGERDGSQSTDRSNDAWILGWAPPVSETL